MPELAASGDWPPFAADLARTRRSVSIVPHAPFPTASTVVERSAGSRIVAP